MAQLNWKTSDGIESLIEELENIESGMSEEDFKNWWDKNGSDLPVSATYRDRVLKRSSYPIWACDDEGFCLVGATADEIEYIDDIEND